MKNKKLIVAFLVVFIVQIFLGSMSFALENNIEISAPSAILIESKTGRILYEKNSNEKRYPASTTKIMTALLTLENVEDLQSKATVSYNAVFSVPSGYSVDTLKVGEELSVEELLYALLVKSSNEAANVLAEYVAGSVDSFATMMNTRAAELGCKNTNFVNPNGIHNENHYSTAYDLSLIAKEAMKNETFRKIVSTVSHTLPSTNKYEQTDRNLITTNDLINKKNKNYYEYAIGIKTGYTAYAKNCLVAGANKDGVELISVVLGTDKKEVNGLSKRDTDTKTLFEYVYNNFTQKKVSTARETVVGQTKIKGATTETKNLDLNTDSDINILVTNDKEKDEIKGEIKLNEDIKAPIAKGDKLGTITYNSDGIEYTANVIAANDVQKSNLILNILRILLVIVLLLLTYLYLKNKRKRKINKKHKKANYVYK